MRPVRSVRPACALAGPSLDLEWIRRELARVGEVAALFRRGDGLLAEPVPDVSRALARLRIEGSVLEGQDLVAIAARARRGAAGARRSPPGEGDRAARRRARPRRSRTSPSSGGWSSRSTRTAACSTPRAPRSPRPGARSSTRASGSSGGSTRCSADSTPPPLPSDASVTVRGGRYVIPVRRDSRSRPAGIVHDESGSAGTLFVEPTEAIELGNALREAEVEEERETLRVLRELTGLLRPELPALRGAVEMCVAVDDLVARARYAVAVEGEVPEVVPAPSGLRIVNGRHPLLLAGSEPVVPFDLEMDPAERTLLISGPNTGGKTVLLKAVGLASAMAQSGIVPPVGAG